MSQGRILVLAEIEQHLLECLARGYLSQRELAREYSRRFAIRARQFKNHLKLAQHAMEVPPRTITSLQRFRVGREYYWSRSDDPKRGDLDLSSKLGGRVRDVFQVGLPDLRLQRIKAGPRRRDRYVLRGYSPFKPYPLVQAVFYRTTNDGRLEPIRPNRGRAQRRMRLAWLPAELWDALST